eukprot:scaffold211_cov168-Ochromonas_danica.AAC.13
MVQTENEEIINGICDYAQQHHIKALLQEYLRRVVLNKPSDPVQFLLKTISENPFEMKKEEDQS